MNKMSLLSLFLLSFFTVAWACKFDLFLGIFFGLFLTLFSSPSASPTPRGRSGRPRPTRGREGTFFRLKSRRGCDACPGLTPGSPLDILVDQVLYQAVCHLVVVWDM